MGYDWGGRAACIVSALWPRRIIGLITGGGYNIQNIKMAMVPELPEIEQRYWYQYYFHSERGRTGLENIETNYVDSYGLSGHQLGNSRTMSLKIQLNHFGMMIL